MKSIKEIPPSDIAAVTADSEAEGAKQQIVQGATDDTKRAALVAAFNTGAELAPRIIQMSEEVYAFARERFGDEPFSIIFLDRDARPFFHCFSKLHPEVPKHLYPVTRGITGELNDPSMMMKDEQFMSVPYDTAIYFRHLDDIMQHQGQDGRAQFFQSGVHALQKVVNKQHGKPKTQNVLIFDTGRKGTLMEFTHWFLRHQFPDADFHVEKLFAVSGNPAIAGLQRYDRTDPAQLTDLETKVMHPVSIRLDEGAERIVYGDVQDDRMSKIMDPDIKHTKDEGHLFMRGIVQNTKRIVERLLRG